MNLDASWLVDFTLIRYIIILQVETILDRDNFTMEELLDEDEIIQECKALNSRLINL